MNENNKIINLEREIKKQQKALKEFSQSDINGLTIKAMQQTGETIDSLRKNVSELFKLVKYTADTIEKNKKRLDILEKKLIK